MVVRFNERIDEEVQTNERYEEKTNAMSFR
jgi:hypothetical protein